MMHRTFWALALAFAACETSTPDSDPPTQPPGPGEPEPTCTFASPLTAAELPDFATSLACESDVLALASAPLDASIPGARSLKVIYDRTDQRLYLQNAERFPTHYSFASTHLSGQGKPVVPPVAQFNQTEYYSPYRRFVLGTLSYYQGPAIWAFELAPYDNASNELLTEAFFALKSAFSFELGVRYHPSSQAQDQQSRTLDPTIPLVSTQELVSDTPYQPLNLATSTGRLRFVRVQDLDQNPPDLRDILVLDHIPNDLSVVAGVITQAPQTPLSHLNVLSQNRGTPNMSLKDAFENNDLRELEGQFVELTVGSFDWSIRAISQEEADAWWEQHRPTPLGIPGQDLTQRDLVFMDQMLTRGDASPEALGQALQAAIRAYGGKASHYAALYELAVEKNLRVHQALAVPIAYYQEHLEQHDLDTRLQTMLADPSFRGNPSERARQLAAFRQAIIDAPLDSQLEAELVERIQQLPSQRVRFRSSTNAEDLEGFTGAGLYSSETGDLHDSSKPIAKAIKTVWASTWLSRAYDEREYRGIDHKAVGMALLVSPSFPTEDANGVAITTNLFDLSGREPGFVINAQRGDTSIVKPPLGITSDYFIYYFSYPGQPSVYLSHSNLVPDGTSVLKPVQAYELGQALTLVHAHFTPLYRRPGQPYAMDVEFKFDGPRGGESVLWLKQARPYFNTSP